MRLKSKINKHFFKPNNFKSPNGLKTQKISKNYEQFATTQKIEATKIISYYLIMFFVSVFIYTNSAKNILKKYISSFGQNLKIIVMCFYLNELKEEKKKHNHTTHKKML